MNRFLERLAAAYAPLGHRGRLMDGRFRFAPDRPVGRRVVLPRPAAPITNHRLREIQA
ncbi:MAG: hypothetical protein GAK28_04538 [Luteibacter sp.]|uniref:hypothetical protein n=1 Tax=Luteibacter sp. TaxID=1886636 RepID=UPI0013816950|nr:hypothetical protein [Luteibacter sp.]KAF1003657.1 MAG: hypothetical protein GAK28_04538 [Luteibacter sp.]